MYADRMVGMLVFKGSRKEWRFGKLIFTRAAKR